MSKGAHGWSFAGEYPKEIACKVTLPEGNSWQIFTKGIPRDAARQQIEVEGDESLATGILALTAIVG